MKKILAAVDFSDTTETVISLASTLAKNMNSKLFIAHVISDILLETYEASLVEDTLNTPNTPEPVNKFEVDHEFRSEKYKQEHQLLLKVSAQMRDAKVQAQTMLLKGDPASVILEKAEELNVDMIMMGSRGKRLLSKVLIGSVTEEVLKKNPCKVLIVSPPAE